MIIFVINASFLVLETSTLKKCENQTVLLLKFMWVLGCLIQHHLGGRSCMFVKTVSCMHI